MDRSQQNRTHVLMGYTVSDGVDKCLYYVRKWWFARNMSSVTMLQKLKKYRRVKHCIFANGCDALNQSFIAYRHVQLSDVNVLAQNDSYTLLFIQFVVSY